MAVNIRETESKYEVPEGVVLPALDDLPRVAGTARPDPHELDAEYYDTPDLRLIRAGITLRRRRGGDDEGWHLKLPVGPDTREEVRLPLGRSGRRVPRELSGLVRAYARGAVLGPVARLTTRREHVVLLDDEGESLAEVAVDDVSAQTMSDTTTMSRWQEVEVELTGGDRRLLLAADKVLRRGGLLRSARSAKLERALSLESAPADGAGPALPKGSTAAQTVLTYLGEQVATLTEADVRVRRDDPGAVHDMRVTTRRLRAALQAFGSVITKADTAAVAAELRWLGQELGAARDAEVLAAHLAADLAATPAELVLGPVAARVQTHFAPLGVKSRRALLAALGSARYFTLLDQLDQLLAEPPLGPRADEPAADVLPKAVRKSYRRTARRMGRALARPAGPDQDVALHQARKAAKRARYAAEAAEPVLGGPARRLEKRLKHLQSVLGDHQDTVIARQVARELGVAAHLAGENAFSFGLIHERNACVAAGLRDAAGPVWTKVRKAAL